jgi:hypothetical protein
VPIPPSKKKSGKEQLVLGTEGTKDRQQENKFINDIRNAVAKWRFGGYDGVTNTSRTLLEYWQRPERERKLFFCQIEALETAVYFAELSGKRDSWIRKSVQFNGLNLALGETLDFESALTVYADPADFDNLSSSLDSSLLPGLGLSAPEILVGDDAVTPEPGTLLLPGAGLASLSLLRRPCSPTG